MRFAGEKTEKVTLRERTVTYNNYNEPVEDWSTTEPVYAEFMENHGKEQDTDGQILAMQDVRCKIRYKEKLDPDLNNPEADIRIERGSTQYDVLSVTKQGRRESLMLLLERRQ